MKSHHRERLKALLAEIAAHTWSDCQESCTMHPRYGCCHELFCRLAMRFSVRVWNVILEPTDHPKLPLMGPNGCVAPPHLRPTCAKHTCEANPTGNTGGNQPSEWLERYQRLFAEIEALEDELGFEV